MIERNLADRYRLEGRIGQGGMAIVYAGTDTVLRRRVAIKVLREQLADDAEFVKRFYSEAQHAAKLAHPNIVNIYDVGREGEHYCIVMELVEGATLAEMIEHDGRLPEAVAIDFAAQICNGLAYAHRQGLLHRDVKPANVLVTRDDVVKLSDFGIARAVSTQTMTVTQPGMVMGSVYYLSPEQAQGLELDATSDLYSLGVVLYQMLSGTLPYGGESPIAVALKHVGDDVPRLDCDAYGIGPAVAAIVHKLLQKRPQDRFASASEVAAALRSARDHPHVTTPFDVPDGATGAVGAVVRPGPKPRPSKYPDRRAAGVAPPARRRARIGFVALACALLALAIFAGYSASRPGALLGPPRTIELASFVGDTGSDARHRLTVAKFVANVVSLTSDSVAAGRVIRQEPAPHARLAERATVTLFVSAGPPSVRLLDVRHYSSDDADRYLRDAKLVPKLASVYDASPKGTVLAQRPAPGTEVAVRSDVTLTISKGPRPIAVPDVASEMLTDATNELRGRGLRVVVAERDQNDQIPANVVLSQSPAAGDAVDPGSTVSLTLSAGSPQIAVPAVERQPVDAATDALARLGLVATIEYVVDPSADAGTVLKQDPPSGARSKKGDAVTVSVAVSGMVPDVSGKSPGDARQMLERAGYRVGNLAYVQEGTEGTIARTEPAASTPLHPGETVMLFVSGVSPQ